MEGVESTAIEEEPGSVAPAEAPEAPANVVDLETVPPVEPEARAEEVRAEEVESSPSKKAGGLPDIVSRFALVIFIEYSGYSMHDTCHLLHFMSSLPCKAFLNLPTPMQNASKKKPPAGNGAEPTTQSPSLPSVGKQRSKIPSASPSRINRPSPGRSRIPVIAGSEGSPSLGRDASPGAAGGWSMFTKNDPKPKPSVSEGESTP